MSKNIFEIEANGIRNYLQRNGYDSKQPADHIVVRDPVQVQFGGGKRTEHKDVVIRNWDQAIKFVTERE